MTLEEEMRRATEAKMLTEHPLLIEALEAIRKELTSAWIESPARDVEGREMIYLGVKILNQFEARLHSHITTGKMAKIQLESEQRNTNELH